MNQVSIEGYVYGLEIRYTQSGMPILSFNLSFYDGKDNMQKAKYGNIRVKTFKSLAENTSKVLHDKSKVVVTGRLSYKKLEKEGRKHSRNVILASDVSGPISKFGQSRGDFGNAAASGGDFGGYEYWNGDGDIPF